MAGCGRDAPLVRRGHRRLGRRLTTVRRASRLSGSSGASARGAGSNGSVSSGIRSPPVRVLALAMGALGAERIERSPRGLRPRRLPLHHAPPPFRGAEHESLRSQYAGEPATGCVGLFFVAMRVMVCRSLEIPPRISKWRRPPFSSPQRTLDSGSQEPSVKDEVARATIVSIPVAPSDYQLRTRATRLGFR